MATTLFNNSDTIHCNNYAYLVFQHKKDNDEIFINRMSKTVPHCVRPIDDESKLWSGSKSSRIPSCDPDIMNRGGNAPSKSPHCIKAGYQAWPSRNPNDFLLIPCETNTWRNYVDCDAKKCCSVHHQMFGNVTKRK